MDGVRGDDVELLARGEDVVPRVVVDHLHALVVQDVVVLAAEILGGDPGDQWLDLADDDLLYARIQHETAGRDTRAETHHQHGPWLGMEQRGKVPEHTLK